MVLLTGATGFLGAHLLCDLLHDGQKVRAIKRAQSAMGEFEYIFKLRFGAQAPGKQQDLLQQVQWVEADLLDPVALAEACEGITHIYHVAAVVSFVPAHREQMMRVNVQGTANLVNIALDAGVQKFCYASSVAALGRAENGFEVDENTAWTDSKLNSRYAISKYLAELEVWRGAEEGLTVAIASPGVIIGPGKWDKGSCRMFAQAARSMPFYTEGMNGFVDVGDATRAMRMLMEGPFENERYIVVGANISFGDLFKLICKKMGNKEPYIKVAPWMMGLGWRLDKLRSLLTGMDPLVTRETARSLYNRFFYKTDKITATGFRFTALEETVQHTVQAYRLKD